MSEALAATHLLCFNGAMRSVRAVVFALAGLAPATAFGEVVVQAAGGRIDLRATATPLSEILDRLARATGMKVVNEGPPPRQPLTLTLAGRTPAEAVLGVLDGLGLNYALKMDVTGTRVETLILSGAAPPSTATPPPAAAPQPMMRPPQPVAPQVEAEEEAPSEEEAEEPDEGQQPQRPGAKGQKAEEGQTNAPVGPRPTFPMMPGGQPFPVSPFAPVAPPVEASPAPPAGGQPADASAVAEGQ
jgi:hypothetical protein